MSPDPISTLIFGGASLSGEGGGYGFGYMTEKEAESLLATAWEMGIRTYDTAPIYGFGLSEERLGRYLPLEAHIISKVGGSWHSSKRVNMSNDPIIISKMIKESLLRLNRERIDTYMIHWPDKKFDIREALVPVIKYREKGLIKNIGLANTNLEDIKKALEVTTLQFIQIEGSYLVPEKIEALKSELTSSIKKQSWGTLAKGILTNRVTPHRKFDHYDARSWAPWWKQMNISDLIQKSQPFLKSAQNYSLNPLVLAISFNLNILKFDQVLVGFKSVHDLKDLEGLSGQRDQIIQALNFLTLSSSEFSS